MSFSDSKSLSPGMTAAASALFILFWASGFISAKYGFPYAEPFTFLSLRFAIALAVLLPMMWFWRARWPATRALFAHVVVAGFLVQTVYLIGVFYGIWHGISTGVIALLVGVQPLITGALAGPVLGETVTRRQWTGLALGFTGLSMVVVEGIDFSESGATGVAFGAFALAGITAGTLYQKRFCAAVDIRTAVTIQNGTSLIVIGILAALFETGRIDWTPDFLFALIWSAIALSVIAIALYYLLVRHGDAARVTSLLYLSPPTTAIMGWFIFGETFPPLALAGLAIAVLGVALANRK